MFYRTLLSLLLLAGPVLAQGISPTAPGRSRAAAPALVEDLPMQVMFTGVSGRWVLAGGPTPFVYDLETGGTIVLDHVSSSAPLTILGRNAIVLLAEDDADFTGDGDTADNAFFLLDLGTGALRNSGVSPGASGVTAALTPEWAFLGASGSVIHAWDLGSAGPPVNSGIADALFWEAHESFLLFLDMNQLEPELQIYDAATGQHDDTGLVTPEYKTAGSHSALLVEESTLTGDLNGDGDVLDEVLHVYDTRTGILLGLDLATRAPTVFAFGPVRPQTFQLSERAVAFYVSESRQGNTDLNGDSDALDHVLHLHSFETGLTTNLGLAGWAYQLGDEVLALQVAEGWQSADLNSDRDLDDRVLHVVALADGSVWNAGLATCGSDNSVTGPTMTAVDFKIDGTRVAFEGGAQCRTQVAEATSRTVVDTGAIATNRAWSGGELALLSPSGSPTAGGRVLSFFRPSTSRVFHTGVIATGILRSDTSRAHPVLVTEFAAGRDLNQDGDMSDTILRIVRPGF